MNRVMGVIVTGVFFAAVARGATTPAADSADWLPVDQDVWAIMMEEPQAHLLTAEEALSNKDAKGAAAEIRRADAFLKIQEKRLATSSRQLERLAKDVESGKIVSPKEVEGTFNSAVAALDHRQPVVPIMGGVDTLYVDEADYHLAQAKRRFNGKDVKAAATEIRRAAAYLKLKGVHAGGKTKSELLASAAELEDLAKKVEGGTVAAAKDLEEAFRRAHAAIRRVL